jgi:hypothetical protein
MTGLLCMLVFIICMTFLRAGQKVVGNTYIQQNTIHFAFHMEVVDITEGRRLLYRQNGFTIAFLQLQFHVLLHRLDNGVGRT